MKVGDIVKVDDSSYSMLLEKGTLKHVTVSGGVLQRYCQRVLSSYGKYPTDRANDVCGINNVMLVDVNNLNRVAFTQKRFCSVITPSVNECLQRFCSVIIPSVNECLPKYRIAGQTVEATIPYGTKYVHLTLQ